MKKEEFGILVKRMKAVYSDPKFIADKDAFDVWFSLLKDLEYGAAGEAIQRYMKIGKFPPTVADIREQYVNIVCGTPISGSEAWALVLDTLKLVEQEGCASKKFLMLPEYIQEAVGGRAQFLEWADNPGFNKEAAKSIFLKCYAIETGRYVENVRLHPEIYRIATQGNKMLEAK